MNPSRPGGQTRERIRQTAMRLVVERGVEGVSVRDIAQAVGMKPSNLYAHFTSKTELVDALFAEGYAAYGEQLAAEAGRAAPFAARLVAMIRLMCALHDSDTTRFRFLLLAQHGALARLDAGLANPVSILGGAIETAMRDGEIPPADPMLLTAMVVGVVVQAATFLMYGRLGGGMAGLADALGAACLRLVSPAPEIG
jgi:AcrR family transcriptional regulator